MSSERIVDVVFSRTEPHAWRRGAMALASAVGFYAAAGAFVSTSEGSLAEWSESVAGQIGSSLDRRYVIERVTPPAPPPAPTAEPPPPPDQEPAAEAPKEAPQPATQPAFAKAGAILAQDPDPNAAVDLTGNTFVTGLGTVYSGGLTRPSGTSTAAVRTASTLAPPAPRPPPPLPPPAVDKSQPVGLPSPYWSCPWPVEAENEAFSTQVAVIRVVVRADGSVQSAAVVVDPGFGFGEAARRCALRSRFVPAKDPWGRPTAATSPPIRVRFTR